ncbi:DNA polymerase eta [Spatholobus suberectus]|nr:DNA polymerase eta [Spatholobus suberectus]
MSPASSSFQKVHQYSLTKAWKSLVFPTIKLTNLLSLFLKAGLALCTFFIISLFFYLSLSLYSHNYHHSPSLHLHHFTISHSSSTFENNESTNISHIVFGIGGSTKTWQNRRHYTELWWQPNVTRGFMWLELPIPSKEMWPETLPPYKVSGNTTSFKYTHMAGSRSAIRLARILKETFQLGLENVRWFVMGDDDTVFFTENLVTVLAKYDHNEMYYIGGNSESVEQNVALTYDMAYGGGGFAISYPLAAALVKILDGCINRYAALFGSDQKVQACISEIGVQLTKELGFHQTDIRGNLYGLLAAHPMAPLVSLHHLDAVNPLFFDMTQVESLKKLVSTYKMDPGRTLQKSVCYDLIQNWTISVSWGYNVELYRSLQMPNELQTPFKTFKTWRGNDDPFTFNTRLVSLNPCERPLVFYLDRIEDVGLGEWTQSSYKIYEDVLFKEFNCSVPAVKVQYINVTASYFKPELWKKAPRRQCCNIIEGTDEANNVVQVEIRGCHHFESATPP